MRSTALLIESAGFPFVEKEGEDVISVEEESGVEAEDVEDWEI